MREYARLSREAGLIPSPKVRAEKIGGVIAAWEGDWQDSAARAALAEGIAKTFEVQVQTAQLHIRDYAVRVGIVLPTVQRTPLETLVAFVNASRERGYSREQTIAQLKSQFGYTDNSAGSAYSRVLREQGITQRNVGVNLAKMVDAVIAAEGKPRKEAVSEVAEATGYAENTVSNYFTYLPFAKALAAKLAA